MEDKSLPVSWDSDPKYSEGALPVSKDYAAALKAGFKSPQDQIAESPSVDTQTGYNQSVGKGPSSGTFTK